MKYALALMCGAVVLLSLVSVNATPGNAQSGWQPSVQALESQVGELQAENAALTNCGVVRGCPYQKLDQSD